MSFHGFGSAAFQSLWNKLAQERPPQGILSEQVWSTNKASSILEAKPRLEQALSNTKLSFLSANHFLKETFKENLTLSQYVHKQASQTLDLFTYIVKIKGLALQSVISSTLDALCGTHIIKKLLTDTAQVNPAWFFVKATHHVASDVWREQAAEKNGSSSQNAEGS